MFELANKKKSSLVNELGTKLIASPGGEICFQMWSNLIPRSTFDIVGDRPSLSLYKGLKVIS